MKRIVALIFILGIVFACVAAWAVDMRVISQKAQADYNAALSDAAERRKEILQDRTALQNAVADMQSRVRELRSQKQNMEDALSRLLKEEKKLITKQAEDSMEMTAYANGVRDVARDLSVLLSRSQFTARQPERPGVVEPIADPRRFPGIDEINMLADMFFEEMTLSGEVERFGGKFIGQDGREQPGTLVTVGPFCTVYNDGRDVGFLRYAEAGRKFYALTSLPPWRMRRVIQGYMAGKSEAIYVDPSIGTALGSVAYRSTLVDKIRQGGILVWPILAIGLVALVLICERLIFLHKVHANTDRLMGNVNELAAQGNWTQCHEILSKKEDRPVVNVLKAGLGVVNESREYLENVLQEAILKELPRLERFLPTLNVMAAVAPLLGLLGTVTGMITTFQVISLYGTGNPRLMAGGISEALVTTMLGLAVAIPIMLVHAFLRRRIEHIVGDMEEKALTLSNVICRENGVKEQTEDRSSRAIGQRGNAVCG